MYYFFLSFIVLFFSLCVGRLVSKKNLMSFERRKLTDDVHTIIKINKDDCIVDDEII